MRDLEIPNWLKGLPLAPEFRPTDTEFADPIAYISKIEKQASVFGICKVIPPLPKPSKKYVVSNLNKSLLKCPELGQVTNLGESGNEANDGAVRAVFTTRQQELGQNAKATKKVVQPQPPAVRKLVWQSGEIYTLEQFESKSKAFAKNQLGLVRDVNPLVVEALFWKAASEEPIHIEYANDVPGSGFGEPEGSFRYFHRRRRRRTFNRNTGGGYNIGKYQVNSMSSNCENKEEPTKNSSNSSREASKASISLPTISSNPTSQFSRQKSSNTAKEVVGSAGWKLSNSPWNLQVIARSPGSLTRFMPDDIPGVTSPMVYIGMLFSWFAWHVEDHELHSLNFLHTGSPKTWYAVPGDHAFAFEEVIRNQGYGGNIDRLASLTLLGEKTTLLSPEVIVESGIPCCRLIQNPGEFVVTFPRAYHVGFSHGFNCGEAANFGTSKWLNVAKEAAVRRAAMNHLPMLSHQQLLYLLTMSFASRVPRSLLPGARSSRLRDRQKEERELSVKTAFIEDILNENNLLTILLGKSSSNRVVLWDLESLPLLSKDPELSSNVATVETAPRKDDCCENKNQDLFSEMSLYMETVNDLYMDDDDLSCNFQVDSGALSCVACGILGFPFMAVVQPSERASMDLLQDVSKSLEFDSPAVLDHMIEGFVSDGLKDKTERNAMSSLHQPNEASSNAESANSLVLSSEDLSTSHNLSPPTDLPVSSEAKFEKGWSATRGFLRPRIFCLEHAIQIEEMLRSKGGTNVLVICHSDFQKIKAHVAAIVEEISSPFGYNEISLVDASQEDLNLIDLAIDGEEPNNCGEDWTSRLSINLRHCVKVRKNYPTKQVQHALALGGLFSDTSPISNPSNLKWPSRKSRSRRNLNHSVHSKPSDSMQLENPVQVKPSESIQMEKDEVVGAKLDDTVVRKEGKLLQYSRKSFKSKPSDSGAEIPTFGNPKEHVKNISQNNLCNIEETGKRSWGLGVLDSNGKSEMQNNSGVLVSIGDLSGDSVPSQITDLPPEVENGEGQIEGNLEEVIGKVKATSDSTTGDSFEIEHEIKVDESIQKTEICSVEKSSGSISTAVGSTENLDLYTENQNVEDSEGQCSIHSDGDVLMKEASAQIDCTPSADYPLMGSSNVKREQTMVEELDSNSEVVDCVLQQEIQGTSDVAASDQSTSASVEESLAGPMEMNAAERMESDGENPCLADENEMENTGFKTIAAEEMQSDGENPCLADEKEPENTGLTNAADEMRSDSENRCLGDEKEPENTYFNIVCPRSPEKNGSKRRRKVELQIEDHHDFSSFIKSPCEGLRPRAGKDSKRGGIESNETFEEKPVAKKAKKPSDAIIPSRKDKKEKRNGSHKCDLEGCRMSFKTRADLLLHKRNRCPHEGCGKKFSSHKYAVLHQRVHEDDRPLKCPWEGCTMSFKWAWARTEHIRVHTGERPYECQVEDCGLTFRFISDFNRHRRKYDHYVT